jgi:HK97 family phage major capsid protein
MTVKTIDEIAQMIEIQGEDSKKARAVFSARLDNLEQHTREIEKKAGRPNLGGEANGRTAEQEEHFKAFDNYVRRGDDSALNDYQRKAMQSGSDPDGGYTVLPEMDAEIDRVSETISAMYRLADVRTTRSPVWSKLVKTSGMAMRRVADGDTGGETTEPRYSKITIEVHTAEAEPWVYNETLEDSFADLETDLADEAGIAFAEGGGNEFINGDGVGKARGILSYTNVANSAFEWGSIGYIPSGKSAAFASVAPADKLISLQHSLKPQFRKGAVFLMNDATLGVVRQLKDASGSYYLFQRDPNAEFVGFLLGHPVEIDNNMPDIGAGAYAIAFGNFKRGYKIINRTGTTVIRDNITEKGKTKFNFRRRFGGGVFHFEAIKLMKFATS